MMLGNAFSNDVSCSWYEVNLHPKAFICVVCVESYYDGKKIYYGKYNTVLSSKQTFIDNQNTVESE